jgi:hypothetical protein
MSIPIRKVSFTIDIIILLFLLFLVCLVFSYSRQRQNLGILVSNWPDPNRYKKNPEIWGDLPPKRNYVDIILTGNNSEDELKLNFSQLKMREILLAKDSSAGIHFKFDSNSEYWTFIKALRICKLEKALNYIPHNNHFWFFYRSPAPIEVSNKIETRDL